jgi:hypothetical protein
MSGYKEAIEEVDRARANGNLVPTLEELMWRDIRADIGGLPNFATEHWGRCWYIAHKLGYPLTEHQWGLLERWRGTQPDPPPVRPWELEQ